jgi:pyruvate formate lyase activating enzyme
MNSVQNSDDRAAVEMSTEPQGTVFNIQRYSIDDGPGIRTTVFLKGCPLRCTWCSNPESQAAEPEVSHSGALCKRCGHCAQVCELRAITVTDSGTHIDRAVCNNCGRCVEACSYQAMKMLGRRMTVEEVLREVIKDKQYYEISGGGVTVSGGEPLFQPQFVAALLRQCRENGVHTCVETCGFGSRRDLDEILTHADLVLFDVKVVEEATHVRLTGRGNRVILDNLDALIARGIPLVIRVPVVPGQNDAGEQIADLARIMKAKDLKTIELMPYHKYGSGKYEMLGRHYALSDIRAPSDLELESAKHTLESAGIACEIVK